MILRNLSLLAGAAALTACSGMGSGMGMSGMGGMGGYSQSGLPDAVKVPAGHKVAMETVGTGTITYECKAKAAMPSEYEWAFVGPDARLMDRGGKQVGRYYGPPATWESADGSKLTGTQVSTAPNGGANIPLQLVKGNPAMGAGAMQGVSYVQRVATMGGTAPAMTCAAAMAGQKQIVKYQADYIFYRAAM